MSDISFITAFWPTVAGANEVVRTNLQPTIDDAFWRELLGYLDAITDKDFVFVDDSNYDLRILEARLSEGVSGDADAYDGDVFNAKFDVVLDIAKIPSGDLYEWIARHEMGHVMGLKHPFADPLQPFTNDTVMSYTPNSLFFSDLDKAALIKVNGIEDDVPQVYRMFNKDTGSHFYTSHAPEAYHVATTAYDTFGYDGTAFYLDGGEVPLYRYYNPTTGAHFYTLDQSEGATFIYEGVAFGVESSGDPVYRLLNTNNDSHFYTADQAEIDSLGEHYLFEGIAFYA